MNFDAAFTRLLGHEGSYSNHPADKGGPTNWGVTEAVARAHDYQGDMHNFTQAAAKIVYRRSYWEPCRCDELPESVRFDVFDGSVNSGVGQSVKWLQRAVGADADGVIGPQTLRLCALASNLSAKYNGHRLLFMTQLKVWPVFSGGWAKRIAYNLIGD